MFLFLYVSQPCVASELKGGDNISWRFTLWAFLLLYTCHGSDPSLPSNTSLQIVVLSPQMLLQSSIKTPAKLVKSSVTMTHEPHINICLVHWSWEPLQQFCLTVFFTSFLLKIILVPFFWLVYFNLSEWLKLNLN